MGWTKPDKHSLPVAHRCGQPANDSNSVAGSAAPAIMIGLFVAFGGILFGYDTGYAETVMTVAYRRMILTSECTVPLAAS